MLFATAAARLPASTPRLVEKQAKFAAEDRDRQAGEVWVEEKEGAAGAMQPATALSVAALAALALIFVVPALVSAAMHLRRKWAAAKATSSTSDTWPLAAEDPAHESDPTTDTEYHLQS